MLNIGAGEIALIMVVALLILGPRRLPEMARGIGKFMREFRRQTDEVRSTLESEFYRMDVDITKDLPKAPLSATIPALGKLPPVTADPKTANAPPAEPGAAPAEALAGAPAEAHANAHVVDDETVARTLGPDHAAFVPSPYAAEHDHAGDPQDEPPPPPLGKGQERA